MKRTREKEEDCKTEANGETIFRHRPWRKVVLRYGPIRKRVGPELVLKRRIGCFIWMLYESVPIKIYGLR